MGIRRKSSRLNSALGFEETENERLENILSFRNKEDDQQAAISFQQMVRNISISSWFDAFKESAVELAMETSRVTSAGPSKPVDTIDLPNQQVYYNSQTQEPTAGFSNNATTIAKQTNGWFSKRRRANLLKRRRIGYAILTTSSWVTSRNNTKTHNNSLCWYQSQATVVKISRSWTSSRNNKTMTFPLRATGKLTRVDFCFCWTTSRYTHTIPPAGEGSTRRFDYSSLCCNPIQQPASCKNSKPHMHNLAQSVRSTKQMLLHLSLLKVVKKYAVIFLWKFGPESPTSPLLSHGKDPLEDLITAASAATRSNSMQAAITPSHLCTPARRLCV
ncbi:hypothetical protein F511_14946 [Dorcoceras hygrometricum]|uniref:Uncharacterized protein n=1 Tax=Dorcoceras hygrometricum TaxID=472368 RepID=A0A2Z7AI69_9LAMI|nr:hypothetical protein F511_14946 [Dorcoceras hygrometricum]